MLVFSGIVLFKLATQRVDDPVNFDNEIAAGYVDNAQVASLKEYILWLAGFMVAAWMVGYLIAIGLFFLLFLRVKASATWTRTLVLDRSRNRIPRHARPPDDSWIFRAGFCRTQSSCRGPSAEPRREHRTSERSQGLVDAARDGRGGAGADFRRTVRCEAVRRPASRVLHISVSPRSRSFPRRCFSCPARRSAGYIPPSIVTWASTPGESGICLWRFCERESIPVVDGMNHSGPSASWSEVHGLRSGIVSPLRQGGGLGGDGGCPRRGDRRGRTGQRYWRRADRCW